MPSHILNFPKFCSWNTTQKNLQNRLSGQEQHLNKQTTGFGIFILFQYYMYILAKFNTFSRC